MMFLLISSIRQYVVLKRLGFHLDRSGILQTETTFFVWFGVWDFFSTCFFLFGFILTVPGNVTGQQLESTFTFLVISFQQQDRRGLSHLCWSSCIANILPSATVPQYSVNQPVSHQYHSINVYSVYWYNLKIIFLLSLFKQVMDPLDSGAHVKH